MSSLRSTPGMKCTTQPWVVTVPNGHHANPESDMHFLTSLIIVVGFAFVLCFCLVRIISDFRSCFHESPVIRETPSKLTAEEDTPAKAVESRESRPTELIDTC
jgi:flagellar biogenesis protein FliO